jgi:hypothetical protein
MVAAQILTDKIAQAATIAEQLSNELTLTLATLHGLVHAAWVFAGAVLPQT